MKLSMKRTLWKVSGFFLKKHNESVWGIIPLVCQKTSATPLLVTLLKAIYAQSRFLFAAECLRDRTCLVSPLGNYSISSKFFRVMKVVLSCSEFRRRNFLCQAQNVSLFVSCLNLLTNTLIAYLSEIG